MSPVDQAQTTPGERTPSQEPPEQSQAPAPQDQGPASDRASDANQEQAPGQTGTLSDGSAQGAPAGKSSPGAGLLAVGILLGLCLLGGVLVLVVRRRMLASEPDEAATASLMDSLRAMLRRGEITQEEFDATKRSMVARLSERHGPRPERGAQGQGGGGV